MTSCARRSVLLLNLSLETCNETIVYATYADFKDNKKTSYIDVHPKSV